MQYSILRDECNVSAIEVHNLAPFRTTAKLGFLMTASKMFANKSKICNPLTNIVVIPVLDLVIKTLL